MNYKSVLRMQAAAEYLGLSRSGFYDRLNPASSRFDSTLPRPVQLGSNSRGLLREELDQWLQQRPRT